MHLLLQFHGQNKIYNIFHLQKLRAEQYSFIYFLLLKNQMQKNIFKIFLGNCTLLYNICFVLYFFYWKQMENGKTKTYTVQVIQFPVKCLFNHLGQKLWEKIISCSQSVVFAGEGKNTPKQKTNNVGKKINENYVEFDFRIRTVLFIFSFF